MTQVFYCCKPAYRFCLIGFIAGEAGACRTSDDNQASLVWKMDKGNWHHQYYSSLSIGKPAGRFNPRLTFYLLPFNDQKCDHGKMYEKISDENLMLMRERLMETVIWPTDDTNTTEKIG